jgi:imidazole glycerol phosphate synthase subunit HisF
VSGNLPGRTASFPGADAALVASLLHYGKTTIPEIKRFAASRGVCIRPPAAEFVR